MTVQKRVLTDVRAGRWLDEYDSAADQTLLIDDSLRVRKRRLYGGKSDGVDVIVLQSGTLSVWLLPTRGMGVWKALCGDVDLSWQSPVEFPVHPALVDLQDRGGLGWLNGFNELLCRCGLSFNGPPGVDRRPLPGGGVAESTVTLHGRIANIPAHHVEIEVGGLGEEVSVIGMVEEASMFGPRMQLSARYTVRKGSEVLEIEDEVVNLGGQPAELELLYHINLGPPLLGHGARVVGPFRTVCPRDVRAAEDVATWNEYRGPTPGYAEQVYFMDFDAEQEAVEPLLIDPRGQRAFGVRFDPRQLPCFTLWKNTQLEADGYVTGLEPATNYPNFIGFEREQGRVRILQPGDAFQCRLELRPYLSEQAVAEAVERSGGEQPRVLSAPTLPYAPAAT